MKHFPFNRLHAQQAPADQVRAEAVRSDRELGEAGQRAQVQRGHARVRGLLHREWGVPVPGEAEDDDVPQPVQEARQPPQHRPDPHRRLRPRPPLPRRAGHGQRRLPVHPLQPHLRGQGQGLHLAQAQQARH